jgi:hypothetical protein
MLIALIGIGGVLLGGFLNAAGTYVMARRAEQRDLRTAARILLPELLENQKNLEDAFRTGRWDYAHFETRRWAQYELTVVKALGKEWAQLTAVYTAFVLLNGDREIRKGSNESIHDDGDDFTYFELTVEAANKAVETLRRFAGLGPGDSLRIQEFYGV